VKSARKQLRESQPFWGTRELSLNPESLCMAMLDGLPLFVPAEPLANPVAFSRKAKLHAPLSACLRDACEKRGVERAIRLAREYQKVLWAHASPPLTETPQNWAVDVGTLIQFGCPESWFKAPTHLGRTLLHQLVEMPDQHVLLLLAPVVIGDKVGHLLGLAFIDSQDKLETYAV